MNCFKSIAVFFGIFFLNATTNVSKAQIGHMESEKDYWYAFITGLYADGGLGMSTVGYAGISNLNLQLGDSMVLTIGATRTWDRFSAYSMGSDYYATAGYIFKKKKSISAFSLGLGYGMYKDYLYDYSTNLLTIINSNKVGLVVQGKYYYCPLKFVGIGVQLFADANAHRTNGAILFSISIGKLNYLY